MKPKLETIHGQRFDIGGPEAYELRGGRFYLGPEVKEITEVAGVRRTERRYTPVHDPRILKRLRREARKRNLVAQLQQRGRRLEVPKPGGKSFGRPVRVPPDIEAVAGVLSKEAQRQAAREIGDNLGRRDTRRLAKQLLDRIFRGRGNR